MKNVGVLLLINVLIVAGYCLFATTTDAKRVWLFAGLGLFAAIILILGDRIATVKVRGVGEITAAADRAVASADRIGAIERDVVNQRDSIALISRDAVNARDDISRISGFAAAAKAKTDELEKVVAMASKSSDDIKRVADFNLLLTRLDIDDRPAFDQLIDAAENGAEPFRSLATQALVKETTTNYIVGGIGENALPALPTPFYPKTATIAEYHEAIDKNTPDIASVILGAFWRQDRFSKYDKLGFVINVLALTRSIRVLTDACRILGAESGLPVDTIHWKRYVDWWTKNRLKYSELAVPKS